MRAFHALIGLAILLGGCDSYPRDIEGTLDRVEAQKLIRVGLIAGSEDDRDRALTSEFLDRIERATSATARLSSGSQEALLVRLEEDQLDLVMGDVASDSPWVTDVALIEPLAEHRQGEHMVGLHPIARNGENRWIMLLEREARNMGSSR